MVSTESHDERILRLLRDDKHDAAFHALSEAYRDRLYRLCVVYMCERARAEDALQESLCRIWRALPKYNARASLYTWIYAITRNQCRTELKRQRKSETLLECCDDDDSAAEPFWDKADPESIVMQHTDDERLRTQLRAMVDRLPDRYRKVILLFHYEDCSVRETAAMLGLLEATVRTWLHRGRRALFDQRCPQGIRPTKRRGKDSR